MTKEQVAGRLKLCKRVINIDEEDWSRMCYSNKCYVKAHKTGIQFCRKRDEESWCDEGFFLIPVTRQHWYIHILT